MGCYSSKELQETQPVRFPDLGGIDKDALDGSKRAIRALLGSKDRDYLVDGSGKKVKLDHLKGHTLGLLFSAHAVPSAREFTRLLAGVYKELKGNSRPFEVVFLSNDESLEIWKESMKEMPWLAVPYSDREIGDNLGVKFGIADIPTLVLVDLEGNKLTGDGVEVIQSHGAKAWPFSRGRLSSLKELARGKTSDALSRGTAQRDAAPAMGKGVNYGKNGGYESPRESQVAPENFGDADRT